MTWRHVTCIVAALALPVICGFSQRCAAESLKEVIGLSGIVIAAVMGNASTNAGAGAGKKDPPA